MTNNINIITLSVILIIYIIGLIASVALSKLKSSIEIYKNIMIERIKNDESIIYYSKQLSIRMLFCIAIIITLLLFNLK